MTISKKVGAWGISLFVGVVTSLLLSFSAPAIMTAQEATLANSKIAEEQDYAFAYGLYKDGLFQLAIEQFDKFLQHYPGSLKFQDAKFLRTECVYQLELLDAAVHGFSEFLQMFPGSKLADDATFRLGETYLKQKKFNESIRAFKTVLDNFGDGDLAGEAAYWTGEAYIKIEDFDNGLKYYTLAYDNYPNNRLRDYSVYSIAWTHQRKTRYAVAAEWYQKLLTEYPQSTLAMSALVRIGECSYYLKDYRKAIEQLVAAQSHLTESEQQGEAEYLIGEAYYHLGEFEQARKHYENFLTAYPLHKLTREVQYALAWTLLKQNLAPQAAEAFARVEEKNDGLSHASLYRKAMAEKLSGADGAAMVSLKQVVEKNSAGEYSDNALYESGLMLMEEKRLAEAKPYFEKVVAQFPSSDVLAESYRMIGECLLVELKFDEARDAFERAAALETAPFEVKVSAMYQIGWCYYKSKNYKEAAAQFSRFVQAWPDHPQAHDARYWLAESAYQSGDFTVALKQYQAVASASNADHRENALYGAGWSNLKLNEYNKAIDAFEKLVVQFPNGTFSFDSRLRLGDCYYYLKDYKKAIGVYRTVIRLFPKHEGVDYAHYQLGQTFYRSADNEQASEQFSLLIKNFAASSLADDAQYALGWMLFQKKEYLDAVREFQKLVAKFPESELIARAYYSIGDSYYNLQQYDAAERAYKELIRRFPKSDYIFDAMTGVQYCLVAQGKQDEALAVLDAFVRENPNSPVAEQLFLKKCDLLYGQKKYDLAAAEYQAFLKRFPRSTQKPSAHYWLGMSLAGANRSIEAAAAFEQAATLPQAPQKVVANAFLEGAGIHRRMKNYDQALNLLGRAEKALKGTEYLADIGYLKGAIFYENNASDEAKRQFEFIVSKYPRSLSADKARVGLARIALDGNNYTNALTLAQVVATSRTDEFGAEAQFLSGIAYSRMNDWQNAATAFLRMRYIFPKYEDWVVKAYLELGGAYEALKNIPRAKEAYQNVQKLQKEGELVREAERRLKNLERL